MLARSFSTLAAFRCAPFSGGLGNVEEPGSTGVEEFNTNGTDTTDADERRIEETRVERRIEETIDRMLALRGTDEEATFTLEMLKQGDDSAALRSHGVLAVPSELVDVFGLRQVVASLDLASVSLRGQC